LDATAIITATESGYTARMVSKYRPKSPIVAVTANESVSRRLALVWGVYPQLGKESTTTDEMLDNAVDESLNSGYVTHGDLVVITAGVPVGEAGTTNLMKIHIVGDILAKAQGIGRLSAYGKVVVAKNAEEALAKVKEGSILVTRSTDKEMVPAIEKCVALIAEEGGLTSHAAVVGLNLGIPVLVGVQDATTILKDDQDITVDPQRGVIYDGHASVI
jgi:pyruvate kinase